jgi:hypothetical protein
MNTYRVISNSPLRGGEPSLEGHSEHADGSGLARSDHLHAFQQVLDGVGSSGRLLKKVSSHQAPIKSMSAAEPGARPMGPLSHLSDYLKAKHEHISGMVGSVLVSRDPTAVNRVTAAMADSGVESDFLAKVLGKTISGVDQLTKLN